MGCSRVCIRLLRESGINKLYFDNSRLLVFVFLNVQVSLSNLSLKGILQESKRNTNPKVGDLIFSVGRTVK